MEDADELWAVIAAERRNTTLKHPETRGVQVVERGRKVVRLDLPPGPARVLAGKKREEEKNQRVHWKSPHAEV
jgi:hypothetical protein